MDIQGRILELLRKRGWTLYKLAKEAGIHETTVYDWFNDNRFTPSRKSLECVCAALDISQAEFYSGVDESDLGRDQTVLLELFAQIPANRKSLVYDFLRILAREV